MLNTITPETDKTCHYFWAFVRNYQLGEQRITTEIRDGVSGIFHEDELILEAQQRAMDKTPIASSTISTSTPARCGRASDRPDGG